MNRRAGSPGRPSRRCRRSRTQRPGRIQLGNEGLTLRALCQQRGHRLRGRLGDQLGQAVDGVAGVGHDQQAATSRQRGTLLGGVGALHAGPRLQQRDRRSAGRLCDGDEEALARVGVHDDALVHDHVLLQPALEVVAEGGIGGGRGQVPVVGLHEDALAHPVVLHRGTDGHDAPAALVAGHRGQLAGHVAGDLGQDLRVQASLHLALAGMVREGVQQLRVGEADAHRLHLDQDLRGPQLRDPLGRVEDDGVRGHELDGALGGREGRRRLGRRHESITWPPVTGRACPVSYCWATR